MAAKGIRWQVYNALKEVAEGQRDGWDGCEEVLGVLAELFGWVAKKSKTR